jgi:hypothetical protein
MLELIGLPIPEEMTGKSLIKWEWPSHFLINT